MYNTKPEIFIWEIRVSVASAIAFEKKHIEQHRFDASPALAEQAVHCLELVAELSDAGLSYQFKGGNSLLLILDKPRRFSIDVDIATDESRERIEECLDTIIDCYGVFRRWDKRAHRTKPWLPIASYYLFFDSHFAVPKETHIMLDAQLRRSPYRTELKPVVCGELYAAPVKAELPFASSIIGDKLLTLGPNTLGIPVGKGKEAQRLKHVYDVSVLLGRNPALEDIRVSLTGCLAHENEIQESTIGLEEVLRDTLDYCGATAKCGVPPSFDTGDSALHENALGLNAFAGHLFSGDYTWKRLQYDTARAALTVTAACRSDIGQDTFETALAGNEVPHGVPCRSTGKLPCEPRVQRWWHWIAAWLEVDPFSRVGL
ncbi:MAG: hypothetical protein GF344_10820 [Chitinivibrionales bacterium]|nr:hypothetical protein [Chitinivibrionales bacterium]MBD3357296.1 hypothetical protein [Chitinivibrionales bacterium]